MFNLNKVYNVKHVKNTRSRKCVSNLLHIHYMISIYIKRNKRYFNYESCARKTLQMVFSLEALQGDSRECRDASSHQLESTRRKVMDDGSACVRVCNEEDRRRHTMLGDAR